MDASIEVTTVTSTSQATIDQVQPESVPDAESFAPIKAPEGVPCISPGRFLSHLLGCPITNKLFFYAEKYEELVCYFKYASSSYALICPRPCGNTLVTPFSNSATDILGFVARDSARKEIVVAIRGSASIADVILDAQVALVPLIAPGVKVLSEVRVHAGFLAAWDSVALQVLTILLAEHKIYPDYSLVTTGHSLGGALALLAALSLKGTFPSSEVRTYSYGAPRTGNNAFAETVNTTFGLNAHRVVHANDGYESHVTFLITPEIPLTDLELTSVPTMIPSMLGYHHHGVEYWQYASPPSDSTTVQCDISGEDPKCSLSIPSRGITIAHTNYFGILVSTPFCL